MARFIFLILLTLLCIKARANDMQKRVGIRVGGVLGSDVLAPMKI